MTRIAVLGGGAWGTALGDLAARRGHAATLWAREPDVIAEISAAHRNSRFLPDVALDGRLLAVADASVCVESADFVFYVAPSHVLRAVVRATAAAVPPRAILVVATKGIERGSLALMTDVVAAEVPGRPVVALSGPSFALEVAREQPTAVVAASRDLQAAECVQQAISWNAFRVYTNDDVKGVELGGALKNVMAIATGIAEGLGLGLNSRAALITRGLVEMTRLGVALGARPATFAGLAGMGDLVLTCTGALSRNRAVGIALGQGESLADIVAAHDSVAEGILNTESACALSESCGVEMPIATTVHRILFEGYSVHAALDALMNRELRPEHDA